MMLALPAVLVFLKFTAAESLAVNVSIACGGRVVEIDPAAAVVDGRAAGRAVGIELDWPGLVKVALPAVLVALKSRLPLVG